MWLGGVQPPSAKHGREMTTCSSLPQRRSNFRRGADFGEKTDSFSRKRRLSEVPILQKYRANMLVEISAASRADGRGQSECSGRRRSCRRRRSTWDAGSFAQYWPIKWQRKWKPWLIQIDRQLAIQSPHSLLHGPLVSCKR